MFLKNLNSGQLVKGGKGSVTPSVIVCCLVSRPWFYINAVSTFRLPKMLLYTRKIVSPYVKNRGGIRPSIKSRVHSCTTREGGRGELQHNFSRPRHTNKVGDKNTNNLKRDFFILQKSIHRKLCLKSWSSSVSFIAPSVVILFDVSNVIRQT